MTSFTSIKPFGNVAWQLTDHPCRPAVSAHTERVGPLDVEQIGDLVELAGNFRIDDGHGPGAYLLLQAQQGCTQFRPGALTCIKNGPHAARV